MRALATHPVGDAQLLALVLNRPEAYSNLDHESECKPCPGRHARTHVTHLVSRARFSALLINHCNLTLIRAAT